MIKAVLFDLDNTLVDFTKFKQKAVNAAASAMVKAGLKAEPKKLAKKLLEYYYGYGIESDDAFETFLRKEYKTLDYRVLAAAVNAYLHEKYLHLKPFPHVIETLKKLRKKGFKLGVVSDGLRLKAWMRLNAAGLDQYFDTIVTHEDTGKKKPHKAPFLKACRMLKVKPEECLMIGDWPERDIQGAKQLGMTTIWASYGSINKDCPQADYKASSLTDILGIIYK